VDKLLSLGRRDNADGDLRYTDNAVQKTLSVREAVENKLRVCGGKQVSDLPRSVTKVMKEMVIEDYQLQPGTVDQLWRLVSYSPEIWEQVAKVLTGDVEFPGGGKHKKPTSMHNFTNLGNVPDAIVLKCFRDIVNGTMDLSQLDKSCAVYKAKKRVCDMVIDMIGALAPDDELGALINFAKSKRSKDPILWRDVVARFPLSTSDKHVDNFAKDIVNKKLKRNDTVPGFRPWIAKQIKRDQDSILLRANSASSAQLSQVGV
jgi:hypothetical protein